jgi:hypothetical protein
MKQPLEWPPAMPDDVRLRSELPAHRRFRCGGWSSISMAQGYPAFACQF